MKFYQKKNLINYIFLFLFSFQIIGQNIYTITLFLPPFSPVNNFSSLVCFCATATIIFLIITPVFYFDVALYKASCICEIVCNRGCALWIFLRRNHSIFSFLSLMVSILTHIYRIICGLCGMGSCSMNLAMDSRANSRMFSICMHILGLNLFILPWMFWKEGGNFQNGLSRFAQPKKRGKSVWIQNSKGRCWWVDKLRLKTE